MDRDMIGLGQLHTVAARVNGLIGQVAAAALEAIEELDAKKQDADTAFPSGGIIIWPDAQNNIPDGWRLCDGTDGAPDLSNQFNLRYIMKL